MEQENMKTWVDRFWEKVEIRSYVECWPWKAAKDKDGYGKFGNPNIPAHWERAPRVAWRLAWGNIPKGFWVLHSCDNPACVNPRHLWLGTAADNDWDRERKGRGRRTCGEDSVKAKLTWEKVREIRRKYANKEMNQYELASKYGVVQQQISDIVNGKYWKEVPQQSRL